MLLHLFPYYGIISKIRMYSFFLFHYKRQLLAEKNRLGLSFLFIKVIKVQMMIKRVERM